MGKYHKLYQFYLPFNFNIETWAATVIFQNKNSGATMQNNGSKNKMCITIKQSHVYVVFETMGDQHSLNTHTKN